MHQDIWQRHEAPTRAAIRAPKHKTFPQFCKVAPSCNELLPCCGERDREIAPSVYYQHNLHNARQKVLRLGARACELKT